MTDHEPFLTLAARELHEDLSASEAAELREHVAACPACRALVADLRRDDARLRAVLVADDTVAPRVRRRIVDEAAGKRRIDPRLALAIAAALILAIVGLASVFVGAPGPAVPPTTPPASAAPTSSAAPTPSESPGLGGSHAPSNEASALPTAQATLSGVYTYAVFGGPGRGVSITAQDFGSAVTGRWSLWHIGTNPGQTDGAVTCLVVRGRDAFAYGEADDGGASAFFWVHDGGDTSADRAITWVQDPGEPAAELEGWCRNAGAGYAQVQPVPLTTGDVIVESADSAVGLAAGPSVNGAYSYTVGSGSTRRDSVAARLEGERAAGEWSQMIPASGGVSIGGPVTCLVIDGHDAWLAGPATTASDGSVGRSALVYVHDGGPGPDDDTAVLRMNDPGQTLTTMEGWCESQFIPAEPFPLDDGNVTVDPVGR